MHALRSRGLDTLVEYPSGFGKVFGMNVKGLGVEDSRTISPAFGVNGLQYIHLNP